MAVSRCFLSLSTIYLSHTLCLSEALTVSLWLSLRHGFRRATSCINGKWICSSASQRASPNGICVDYEDCSFTRAINCSALSAGQTITFQKQNQTQLLRWASPTDTIAPAGTARTQDATITARSATDRVRSHLPACLPVLLHRQNSSHYSLCTIRRDYS